MAKRSSNDKLNDSKDMPKVVEVTDLKNIKRFGGTRLLIAPPLSYDEIMRTVPHGKVTTADHIRGTLANQHDADFTCQLTAGIFINIVARASDERDDDHTSYWRTLKKGGELNDKYPGGIEAQKSLLEMEGHLIVKRGKRYFVKDYEEKLYPVGG